MPRDLPVGNGKLLVTFDQDYCLRDIYYPCVGKENHTNGHKFRFGIWVDGSFSWLDRKWRLGLEYADESLVTKVSASNEGLQVALQCNDIVDYRENIYIKKIVVRNLADREREVRLFFHHDYHILESPLANTAYYDPEEKGLIHYKGNRYFLMSGLRHKDHGIDQYAAGRKEFQGLEGTWRDAEDGILEGSPISQGSVDSVISFSVKVPPNGEQAIYYWICVGQNYAEVSGLNRMVVKSGPELFIRRTENYWRAWVNKDKVNLGDLPPQIKKLYKQSLLILRTNVDAGGAIIAGTDSDIQHYARDTYSYMWPRDGALVAYALDMAGHLGITRRFFDFCLEIVSKGKESGGYFLHKYNPDGSLGSSWHPWVSGGEEKMPMVTKQLPFGISSYKWLSDHEKRLPVQEDGTGLVLWALWHHFEKFRDIESAVRQYESMVVRCGDFLASYRDPETGLPLPSYDLWEERWGVHTFTVSAVYAGLKAAERFANVFGDSEKAKTYASAAAEIKSAMDKYLYSSEHKRFSRGIVSGSNGAFELDLTMDASLYAPFYFGVLDPGDERVVNTMNAIRERLWVKAEAGGVARYEGDSYQKVSDDLQEVPGNPWFISTLWLAQWHIARAQNLEELGEAIPIMEWAASRALPSGVLAEQVNPNTNQPLSVSPLTWSHATYVTAVLEYLKKLQELNVCPTCHKPVYRLEDH